MLSPQRVADGVRNVRAAEDAGFDFIGFTDSQSLLLELHTVLGYLARETTTAEIGPSVTNPVTRHPVVTASAINTLNDLTDGRAVLGLASGDSAVFTVGERPAGVDDLEAAVELITALSRGETVEYGGTTHSLSWLDHDDPSRRPPVLLAADGPRTQRAAGGVADRVLIGNGRTEAVIAAANDRIDEGARAAGGDPDSVARWAWVRTFITDGEDDTRGVTARMMAAAAHHNFQFGADDTVPAEYVEPAEALAGEYDSDHHAGFGRSDPNRELVERLDDEHPGFLDYLVARFAVVGDTDECVRELGRIARLDGIDGVHLCPMNPDNHAFVSRMAGVLPDLP